MEPDGEGLLLLGARDKSGGRCGRLRGSPANVGALCGLLLSFARLVDQRHKMLLPEPVDNIFRHDELACCKLGGHIIGDRALICQSDFT